MFDYLLMLFGLAMVMSGLWLDIAERQRYKRRLAEQIRNCPCAEHTRREPGENPDREYEGEDVKTARQLQWRLRVAARSTRNPPRTRPEGSENHG